MESGEARPAMRGAGAMLRAAREGAGLSVDAVAQQLKLAPRQVKAIEDEDLSQLPGRTFVRGFVRNYARLLRLDTATVLAALPDAAATQEAPSLQPPAADMGELPAPESTGLGWTRWAIPAALIAIIAAFALYEFLRPATEPRSEPPAVTSDVVPVPTPAPSPAAASENAGTPLANPVASNAAPDAGATPAASVPRPRQPVTRFPCPSFRPLHPCRRRRPRQRDRARPYPRSKLPRRAPPQPASPRWSSCSAITRGPKSRTAKAPC